MARKPNGEIHSLGHWEKMQIAIALHDLADKLDSPGNKPLRPHSVSAIAHTRELATLFNNEGLVTVTLEIESE